MDNEYQRLINETKEYARLRVDLIKLELLEKMSKTIALIVTLFLSLVLILVAFTYFSLAIVHYISQYLGGIQFGYCIVGGVFLLLTILVLVFQKQWILNPLIKALTLTLFDPEDEEIEENKKKSDSL